MMSDEPTTTPQPEKSSDAHSAVPVLRREAVYVVTDPRKFAGVAAVTALAGVAIGFALALLAQSPHQCATVDHVQPHVRVTPHQGIHSPDWKLTWLGVHVGSSDKGAVVVDVFENTPAERAGLEPGDVIRSLGSGSIDSAGDLVRAVRLQAPGDRVTLDVLRDGQKREITATLTGINPRDVPR